MPTLIPFTSSSEGSEHSAHGRLTFSDIYLQKRIPTGDALSVKLKWGRTDEYQKLRHLKEIYRLIYWKEIICYSCALVPQKRSSSIILGPKQQKRTGALTIDSTWGGLKLVQRPQLIGSLSKAEFTFHPHLISKSWHLWYNTLIIMKF